MLSPLVTSRWNLEMSEGITYPNFSSNLSSSWQRRMRSRCRSVNRSMPAWPVLHVCRPPHNSRGNATRIVPALNLTAQSDGRGRSRPRPDDDRNSYVCSGKRDLACVYAPEQLCTSAGDLFVKAAAASFDDMGFGIGKHGLPSQGCPDHAGLFDAVT